MFYHSINHNYNEFTPMGEILLDSVSFFESKIVEKDGYWQRDGTGAVRSCDAWKYPERIALAVDIPVVGFDKVEYFVLGNSVPSIPAKEIVIKLHRFSHQICKIMINDRVRYSYNFTVIDHLPAVVELYPYLLQVSLQMRSMQAEISELKRKLSAANLL